MDEPREVDDKFLQAEFKRRIATLPAWNNQGKLVKKVQKVVRTAVKTVDELVDGVDTTIWPNWIVDGVNPMLLSDKVRKELGIEAWWLWKIMFALWHPRLFFYPYFKGPNKVKCPGCGSEERVQGDGFPNRERAMCGIGVTTFLLAYRYRCVKCPGSKGQTKSFSSADPLVIAQFPPFIRRQFEETFYVSHRGGLDRETKYLVDSLAVKGVAFSKSEKLVTQCHSRNFHLTKELYYLHQESLEQAAKGSLTSFFKKKSVSSTASEPPPTAASVSQSLPLSSTPSTSAHFDPTSATNIREDRFGKFKEPGCGYRDYIPGAGYWIAGYVEDFKGREKWLQRQFEHTDGEFIRCDHTFQVAKQIRSADGRQSCNNIFSVMNGYGEIIAQQAAVTTSMDEVDPLLAALPRRNARFGFPDIKAGWVDNPPTVKYKLCQALGPAINLLLLDALHAMMVVAKTIPDDHALKGVFMAGMSNAIFQVVESDKELIVAYLRNKGLTTAQINAKPARYFKQHCRRIIPSPEQLVENLQGLYTRFAGGVDVASGVPLFTNSTREAFERLLSHADQGLLSDPFGVEMMFVQTGTWGDGIPRYCAVRGSSPLEGYHRHLALVLSGANNSAELAHGMLTDHKHEWNMNARISKRGQKDYGILDTRPIENIKASCARLGLADPYLEYKTLTFEPQERFGFDALSPGKGPLIGVPVEEQVGELHVVEDDGGASFFEDEEPDGPVVPPQAVPRINGTAPPSAARGTVPGTSTLGGAAPGHPFSAPGAAVQSLADRRAGLGPHPEETLVPPRTAPSADATAPFSTAPGTVSSTPTLWEATPRQPSSAPEVAVQSHADWGATLRPSAGEALVPPRTVPSATAGAPFSTARGTAPRAPTIGGAAPGYSFSAPGAAMPFHADWGATLRPSAAETPLNRGQNFCPLASAQSAYAGTSATGGRIPNAQGTAPGSHAIQGVAGHVSAEPAAFETAAGAFSGAQSAAPRSTTAWNGGAVGPRPSPEGAAFGIGGGASSHPGAGTFFWTESAPQQHHQQKRLRPAMEYSPGPTAGGLQSELQRSPMELFEAMHAGGSVGGSQHPGALASNQRQSALPFGGRMRSKKGVRKRRFLDLSTPVLSAREVEWFVRLQSKHKKGHSTDWAAMLNEWNTTLVQFSLDPNRSYLCQGVMPKSMGQLERFERAAYDAINTCNSVASAAAFSARSQHPTSEHLLFSHAATLSTSHPPIQSVPLAATTQFQATSFHSAQFPQQQVLTQGVRPPPKGPNRGGSNTPHRCVPCSEATGQVVFKKGHKCPLKQ